MQTDQNYFISVVFLLPSFPIPISPKPFNDDDGETADSEGEGECSGLSPSPGFCLIRRRLFARFIFVFRLFSPGASTALSDRLETDTLDVA